MDVINHSVPIEELVAAVKEAVKQAGISTNDTGRDLRIRSVQLTLNAVATTKLGGGLEFRVPVIGWKIKVGSSRSRQRTHTIDLTLVPEDLQDRYELRNNTVEEVLVESISAVRAAVATGAGGDDPLVLEAGTVELVFGITDQGTISLGVEGELTEEITNTLRIELVGGKAGW